MDTKTFKAGDEVRLASEQISMTIEKIDDKCNATCVYINSKTGAYEKLVVNVAALVLYVEEGPKTVQDTKRPW